jgi:hypothetical protein
MMEFFNEAICILLVITITIVFVKTILSHRTLSEPFIVRQHPVYYESASSDSISDRLLQDPDIIDTIRGFYKSDYNNVVVSKQVVSKQLIKDVDTIVASIQNLPDKYNNILNKYNDLNNKYKLKKKEIEAQMVKDFDNTDNIDYFNKKNLLLKNKLRDFTDTLKKDQTTASAYNNGKILKNRATQNELTLVKNMDSGSFDKYPMFNEINKYINKDEDRIDIYYLPLTNFDNQNRDCLHILAKGVAPNIQSCAPKTKEQFFLAVEIKNNEMYNIYIKLSGNFRPEHLVDILDTSNQYPFYIISPFILPGYAVVERNKKISILPVRNDPYQQFNEMFTSSVCEIINS